VAVKIVGGSTPSKDRRRSERSSKHAKDIILAGIRSGMTIRRACEAADRVESTYAYYRKTDPNFRTLADAALQARAEGYKPGQTPEVPDFPEFCEKYLDTKLFMAPLAVVRPAGGQGAPRAPPDPALREAAIPTRSWSTLPRSTRRAPRSPSTT
jgi:hypothetical protein